MIDTRIINAWMYDRENEITIEERTYKDSKDITDQGYSFGIRSRITLERL